MRYALIAILLGAALALADHPVEPEAEVTAAAAHEAPPTPAEVDEPR